MTVTKTPKRNTEVRAEQFIAEAGKPPRSNKILTPVRFAPEMLERIDKGARRLGISRSAFINSATAEKLERMDA